MYVPWAMMNHFHPTTAIYAQGAGHQQEYPMAGVGGGTGGGSNGILSVCTATGDSDVFQVSQTPDHCDVI